jgi:hypothetical protein
MPLVRGHYATTNREWLLDGKPSTILKPNLSRQQLVTNGATLATGVMTSTAVFLEAGELVTNLTFLSGGTAAGTPTNWWFALYDDSATPALLAQSADQLTAAWAANTAKTLALATAQAAPRTGIYYAAINVTATTPPTLAGVTLENAAAAGAIVTGQKILAQTSGSGLAGVAPGTIASPTTVATIPYVIIT